jgi:uncharacterized LabA/DUF88 family protein
MLRGPPGVATPGVRSFRGSIVNRTVFLVDGFNVYHSLRESERVLGRSLFWLDVVSLCRSYLHALPGKAQAGEVWYFSALAHQREQEHLGTVARQTAYFAALEASGTRVRLGQFKARALRCPICGSRFTRWEEKETDVAIGAAMTRFVCDDACDTLVLVTGDTDLAPAFRTSRDRDPSKTLAVIFPFRRANAELKTVADAAFTIKASTYARHQLPRGVR